MDTLKHIYCISLINRDDRYNHACNEFKKVGILDKVIFHRPFKDPRGSKYGSYESFLWCLKDGLKNNDNEPILIFEDDVQFNMNEISTIDSIIKTIQKWKDESFEWDTVRLGHWKGIFVEKYNENLYRGNCYTIHACIWNPEFAKKLLLTNSLSIMSNPMEFCDTYIGRISGRNYLVKNLICYQADGFTSDNIWDNAKHQEKFLEDSILYQKTSHNKTIYLWNLIGSKLQNRLGGIIQLICTLDLSFIYKMWRLGRKTLVLENKCFI